MHIIGSGSKSHGKSIERQRIEPTLFKSQTKAFTASPTLYFKACYSTSFTKKLALRESNETKGKTSVYHKK